MWNSNGFGKDSKTKLIHCNWIFGLPKWICKTIRNSHCENATRFSSCLHFQRASESI